MTDAQRIVIVSRIEDNARSPCRVTTVTARGAKRAYERANRFLAAIKKAFGETACRNKKDVARRSPREARRVAITQYLAALEQIYPSAKGKTRVIERQDNRVIISIPLPARVDERMRLFDDMAEVGTKLLLETDQHIVLSSQ